MSRATRKRARVRHATARVARMLVAALCAAAGAQAAEQGATTQGRDYVSGGVSESERAQLLALRERFSLWIVTAAKKSGAYLAAVQVRIADSQQGVVFDAPLDGPWLMVDLASGRYTIEGRVNGETQRRVATVHAGDRQQLFLYFGVDADVPPRAGTAMSPAQAGGAVRSAADGRCCERNPE